MASTFDAHDTQSCPYQSHTMAIFYRHGPFDLITEEFRSVVLELGWVDDTIAVSLNKCVLAQKKSIHRSRYPIGTGKNPCVIAYQLELETTSPELEMKIIGDSLIFKFCVYQNDPRIIPEWVLEHSIDWLFQRLKFAAIS